MTEIHMASGIGGLAETDFSCSFDPNGWSEKSWIMVDRPDLKKGGGWIQLRDCIENDNAAHTSMVYNKKYKGDVSVSCTMSFLDKYAPSITIVSNFVENQEGRMEYKDFFEVVLYYKGDGTIKVK